MPGTSRLGVAAFPGVADDGTESHYGEDLQIWGVLHGISSLEAGLMVAAVRKELRIVTAGLRNV
jgi:hypothetical protein